MIKYFSVSNYKNFKDTIVLDFSKVGGYQYNQNRISNGLIGKVLIYGRNATGKTNLGSAIMDIALSQFFYNREEDSAFVNADSTEKYAAFFYVFQFGKDVIEYKYDKLAGGELAAESCKLNGETVFSCNYEKKEFWFDGLSIIDAETVITERFVEGYQEGADGDSSHARRISFLGWMFGNVALSSDSPFIRLDMFIRKMSLVSNIAVIGYRPRKMYEMFFKRLADSEEMQKFERFMNSMGVPGTYVVKKLPDGAWNLYSKHKRLIPFYENASSGTIALMNLYRRLVSERNASFIYMDEFDAFYHYEMSCKLVEFFCEEYPNCQILFTTHNTNLMTNRLIRPDCVMILSRNGRLTALCDATHRELREGHNLEKMYISGEFEDYE